MRKVVAIALNTLREALRERILYNLLLFALLLIGASVLLGTLTIGEQVKIIKDMGLASISIFGTLIAIFVGIGLVFKELERKSIYSIMAKPVQRAQFLLGRYVGLLLTLFVQVVIMSLGLLVLVVVIEHTFDAHLLKAIVLIFVEIMVITAVALLFSTFSTPVLSGLFTLAFYIIGHLSRDLLSLGSRSESNVTRAVARFLYYLLPNLENFNIKGQVVYHEPIPWGYMGMAMAYGFAYLLGLLLLAMLIFERKDFK